MTVQDLIYTALRLAKVLRAPGRGPSPEDLADGLAALNSMLDSWNTERLTIYTIERNTYTLVSGTAAYTIGAGGTFNTARPVRVEKASLILTTNPAQPVELFLEPQTVDQWKAIRIKTVPSPIPTKFYYEQSFPLGILHLWPVPNQANDVALYVWHPTSQFTATSQVVSFPPGYQRAIEYNLAVDLAPRFPEPIGRPLDPLVLRTAIEAKSKIKALNIPLQDLKVDNALLSRQKPFNIWTGE